jgi:hypothetical protein
MRLGDRRDSACQGNCSGVIVGGSIGLAIAALGHGFEWLKLKSGRAFDLWQSVYVEAAGAMANSLDFFAQVAQMEVADTALAAILSGTSAALYKIHVVGTPATITALSEANQALTFSALDPMKRRVRLRSAIQAASTNMLASVHADVQRLQEELFLEAQRASLAYQRLLREVNISARRELGLALDESEYRAVRIRQSKA